MEYREVLVRCIWYSQTNNGTTMCETLQPIPDSVQLRFALGFPNFPSVLNSELKANDFGKAWNAFMCMYMTTDTCFQP